MPQFTCLRFRCFRIYAVFIPRKLLHLNLDVTAICGSFSFLEKCPVKRIGRRKFRSLNLISGVKPDQCWPVYTRTATGNTDDLEHGAIRNIKLSNFQTSVGISFLTAVIFTKVQCLVLFCQKMKGQICPVVSTRLQKEPDLLNW
jgi:hypothetical protein